MANQFRVRKGLIVNGSGSTILDIQGSQGQLFSITDSLSGSLFSARDISGIPIIEAFSDNRVNIGTFNAEAIKVSGSFAFLTGSLRGTASNAVTASYVTGSIFTVGNLVLSASNATTASFAFSQVRYKSNAVAGGTFAGNPRKATVTFATAFADTNYSVTITGEDSRTWTIESKLAGSFVINSNSNTNLAGNTYWMAMAYGETV